MDWVRIAARPGVAVIQTVSASSQQQKEYVFIAHNYMFLAKLITGVDAVFWFNRITPCSTSSEFDPLACYEQSPWVLIVGGRKD